MPTTIYTKKADSELSYGGKTYEIKDGAVSVPDDAVDTLVESFGFTTEPSEGAAEEEKAFDLAAATKNQLIELGVELGAEVKGSMTKDEIFAVVKPLWEAKQAA